MGDIKYPKIALGARACGNDGTFGSGIDAAELRPIFEAAMDAGLVELSPAEVANLEDLADSLQINAVRMWEKVMD